MANWMRRRVSSLPRKAESSYMSGPLPVPTRATRHAFQGFAPSASHQGSMAAFWLSAEKSSRAERRSATPRITAAESSFQFFLTNLSSRSNAVGATKQKSHKGQRSETKLTLRFLVCPLWASTYSTFFVFNMSITAAARSGVVVMSCWASTSTRAGANSMAGVARRYSRLNHQPLT